MNRPATAKMIGLAIFAIFVFAMAGVVGFKNPSSTHWNLIDPVYYATASVGVILFFMIDNGQLRELELLQVESRFKSERDALQGRKPNVDVSQNARWLDSTLEILIFR